MFPIRTDAPRARETPVLVALLTLMTLVFFYQLMLNPREAFALYMRWALIPAVLLSDGGVDWREIGRIASSTFLHAGYLHFFTNVWTLWLFGRAVEGNLGSWRMTLLYAGSGLFAGLAHLLIYPTDATPVIGASGAIAGVLGAYARLFPHSRLVVLVLIVVVPVWFRIRAIWYLALWFGLQLLWGAHAFSDPLSGGGVAWWVHIGGFLGGFALAHLVAPQIALPPPDPDDAAPWGPRPRR